MVRNTDKLQASPSTTSSACLHLFGVIFLATGTVVSTYQVRHEPWTMAFVLLSCLDLLALFWCLPGLKNNVQAEYGTVEMKGSLKFAMRDLAYAQYMMAFTYGVPQMTHMAWYVAVWVMSAFAAVNAFLDLIVYQENLWNNDANMPCFPSQTGKESGSANDDLQSDQPAAFDLILSDEGLVPVSVGHPESVVPPMVDAAQTANQINGFNIGTSSGTTRSGVEIPRISFRTKSEVDILDDGFKWHRNGQKYVRNSPHPRKYFRCSTEGCSVKKWVQRDIEDQSFMITTYTGMHNHEPLRHDSAFVISNAGKAKMVPNTDKLQASPSTTRFACLYLLAFIFHFPGTVVFAYQVGHVPSLIERILFAGLEHLTIFLCRQLLDMCEYRTIKEKRSRKVAMLAYFFLPMESMAAMLVFAVALSAVFDMTPLGKDTFVGVLSVFPTAASLCALVYKIDNPKRIPFIMCYSPSQTGRESGSAHDDRQSDQPAAFERILSDEGLAPASLGHPESVVPPMVDAAQTANQINGFNIGTSSGTTRSGVEIPRNSFRTKSEVDILDDGFKWHRNGQKYVRNSPYARKYFRCSTEGCSVKKWVQRDEEDQSYAITTYTGIHNHMSPYDTTLLL